MGLLAAIELSQLQRRLELPGTVRVYEASAYGGGRDVCTAASHCQLWLHTDGQLFASSQPQVTLALQRSTPRLRALAPHAFAFPPAFAIELLGSGGPPLVASYRALGVPYRPVPRSLFSAWLPGVELPPGAHVFRVNDGVIDLPLLADALTRRCRRLGVELVMARATALRRDADRVTGVTLSTGERVPVGDADTVLLACGAGIRPLLATAGTTVPGLRHFQAHLVASDAIGLPALLAVVRGGVNAVPHHEAGGPLVNVFGDSQRAELPPETDGEPLVPDPRAIAHLVHAVQETFGLRLPTGDMRFWPAVKTEIVPAGTRSQAHHAQRVPGLENTWLAIPGKLSQAAACGEDLARALVRERIGQCEAITTPVWEIDADPGLERGLDGLPRATLASL